MAKVGRRSAARTALDIRSTICDTPASIRRQAAGLLPDSSCLFFSLGLRKHLRKGVRHDAENHENRSLIVVTLIGLALAGPSVCFGWSLLHPFASNDQPQTTMVSRTTQKPPSAWQKITTGTKNFFNKTGETLGLKKKPPKKPPAVVAPKPRTLLPQPKSRMAG